MQGAEVSTVLCAMWCWHHNVLQTWITTQSTAIVMGDSTFLLPPDNWTTSTGWRLCRYVGWHEIKRSKSWDDRCRVQRYLHCSVQCGPGITTVGSILAAFPIRSPLGDSVTERLQRWGFDDVDWQQAPFPHCPAEEGILEVVLGWVGHLVRKLLWVSGCAICWGEVLVPCLSPLVYGGSCSTWRLVVVALGVLEASIVGGLA